MHGYTFDQIESKWQQYWEEHKTFRMPDEVDMSKPKYYVLDMFPYPSGVGLHVGHPLGYIATDIIARYKRMKGFNVLHPMGFDAFGLPAEQFAVEHGVHPRVTTEKNIANMIRQLKRLGLSYDWDRQISTTDEDYYKWTQWIFLQLFHSYVDPEDQCAKPITDLVAKLEAGQYGLDEEFGLTAPNAAGARAWKDLDESERYSALAQHRLAFMAEVPVNWCPALGTVLANEEVTNEGRSERGNYPVYKRPLRQWMLRITAFAERLETELDLVDWPEPIRIMQRNWIGRSQGAHIDFTIEGYEEALRVRPLRLGDESEDVARTLNNLGQCYYRNEDYNRALECFKGTLRVSKKKLGDNHEKIGDTLNSMGEVYTKLRKFQEAQEHFLGALTVRRKTLGDDHVDTATTLHNLGDVYYMINDYDNAMKSYQEAFRIRYFKLGADDVDTAYTRNNMGVIRLKRGENQEALECFTEALRVRQALLGKTHEKTSDTLHNLGLVYKNLKEYQKAIDMYRQALEIRQAKANGDSCLKSADTLYNIGIVYANSNFDDKYMRALEMFQQCLDTYQDAGLADDHPSIQNTTQWISWATKRMAKK